MEKTYRLRFYLSAPVALDSPIHLDGVLAAVHPAMHNQETSITRFDSGHNIVTVPLPLCSFRAGGNWVWACTAGEFPEIAKFGSDSLTKRRNPQDYFAAQRTFMPGSNAMKDKFITFQVVQTPYIDFLAISNDPPELHRIAKRVKAIGGKRKSGWGEVRACAIIEEPCHPKEILILDNCARRRLPKEFLYWAESITPMQCRSPYWHPKMVEDGAEVGTQIALNREITISRKRGESCAVFAD